MSKLKQMIVSAFAVCALAVGVGINPVTAYAEDSAVIPEISAEIETSEEVAEDSESVENSEDIEANPFISKTFTHEENGERIELTIVDEENAVADMWDKGMPFAKVYLTYVWTGEDTLELRAMDGSYFDEVRLYESGLFEVVEGTLNPSPSEDIEAEKEIEGSPDGVVEKTSASEWFEETIKPMLIQYGASVAAFATVAFIAFKKVRKMAKEFKEAVEAVKKSNDENLQAKAEMDEMRAENAKWKQEVEESLVSGVKDIGVTVHKILDVEKIAYVTDPTLVSNGTAKKIAEVINEEKKDDY